MDDALTAAEKSRRLEGAVELAAELQVLGGEFAKSDPFEMLFLSRNDPAKFQQKISELTKGMATLNKVGDDFEFQLASPMARDLLENAGKALGISTEKMTEMALQQAKINKMRQDMFNAGYTKEQKEIIEGLAQMDSSTGKFFVNVKGVRRDIADLSKKELQFLDKQSLSLQERAKNAQTFDDQFKIFMLELKATGLPLLEGINDVLGVIRGLMDSLTKGLQWVGMETKTFMKVIGVGGAVIAGVSRVGLPLWEKISSVVGKIKGSKALSKAMESGGGGSAAQTLAKGKGAGALAKGQGLKNLGTGAGIGAAGLGIGAGIGAAAGGISLLAESLKELDEKQLETLKGITTTLGWFVGGAAAVAVGASMISGAMAPAIPVMYAFAGVIGIIGASIGIAGAGLGYMAKGFAELVKTDIGKFSIGVAQLAGATAMFINPATVVGMYKMQKGIASISEYGSDMKEVGFGFSSIAATLSGSLSDYAEVRKTVEAISKADFSNLKQLSNLNNLFSKPLKVQFDSQSVDFTANVTLEIDGRKFVEELGITRKVQIASSDYGAGYNAPPPD
jgi:hypothetical protein